MRCFRDSISRPAANRLHNSIAVFAVGTRDPWNGLEKHGHGAIIRVSSIWIPACTFLYVCNQRSDQITAFRIDKETGLLTFTGQYTPVGTPLRIPFLAWGQFSFPARSQVTSVASNSQAKSL